MKKLLSLIAASLICFSMASAQDASQTNIEFNKTKYSGFSISIPLVDEATAEAAIKERFEKGVKVKSSKQSGFITYLNTPFDLFGSENYDIYFDVTETGKKDNKRTVINIICCKGNMNAITNRSDETAAKNILSFLNGCELYINEYMLRSDIQAQVNQIDKLTKEIEKYNAEKEKLNKEIQNLDKKTADNRKNIDSANEIIKSLKAKLVPQN